MILSDSDKSLKLILIDSQNQFQTYMGITENHKESPQTTENQ